MMSEERKRERESGTLCTVHGMDSMEREKSDSRRISG